MEIQKKNLRHSILRMQCHDVTRFNEYIIDIFFYPDYGMNKKNDMIFFRLKLNDLPSDQREFGIFGTKYNY